MKTLVTQDEKCAFCQSIEIEVLIPKLVLPDKVSVLRCRNCDLVFLESRVEAESVDREEAAYWDNDEQKAIYLKEDVKNVFVKEFEKRLDSLEFFKPNGGKMLDVGCGVGHFLYTAKRRHWNVKGLDISSAAAKAAKEAYDIDVSLGTLEDADLKQNEFDVVTLWDVIEHIRRPLQNVHAANKFIRMGGVLAIKTPNEHGLFKWIALKCYRWFGPRAAFLLKYVYYVPHYFSYSKKSLDILLKRNGFEPVLYEFDETPEEFGKEKIGVHYKKDPKRRLVLALLPFVMAFARVFRRRNKIIVYAKKMRDV